MIFSSSESLDDNTYPSLVFAFYRHPVGEFKPKLAEMFTAFSITLTLIHLSEEWRWQLVPAYVVLFGLILFGLWSIFPTVGKFITLLYWIPVRWAVSVKVLLSALLIGAAAFLNWAFPDIDRPIPTGSYAVSTTLKTTDNWAHQHLLN